MLFIKQTDIIHRMNNLYGDSLLQYAVRLKEEFKKILITCTYILSLRLSDFHIYLLNFSKQMSRQFSSGYWVHGHFCSLVRKRFFLVTNYCHCTTFRDNNRHLFRPSSGVCRYLRFFSTDDGCITGKIYVFSCFQISSGGGVIFISLLIDI